MNDRLNHTAMFEGAASARERANARVGVHAEPREAQRAVRRFDYDRFYIERAELNVLCGQLEKLLAELPALPSEELQKYATINPANAERHMRIAIEEARKVLATPLFQPEPPQPPAPVLVRQKRWPIATEAAERTVIVRALD